MIFGTRPEIIKLSPVFDALTAKDCIDVTCVFTGQQQDLAGAFLSEFNIPVDYHLEVMRGGQPLPQLLARLISEIDKVLTDDRPNAVIVQGDTSSALAGAMVANLNKIPVWHVEAGLRTFDPERPFPEETNRVLIGKLASHHFAATEQNRVNLLNEGIHSDQISVTGNPIVDVVTRTLNRVNTSARCEQILAQVETPQLIVLTAHRRENFAKLMGEYFAEIREFLDEHQQYSLVAPVHPNPTATDLISHHFDKHPRAHLINPLGYEDFLQLLSKADLIISDSGGIQEEAASLNRHLIVLRESTERPEAIECGCAELAPSRAELKNALSRLRSRAQRPPQLTNPFGDGTAGEKISGVIVNLLAQSLKTN